MNRLRRRTMRCLTIITLFLTVIAFLLAASAVILLHTESSGTSETTSAAADSEKAIHKSVPAYQHTPDPVQPRYTVILSGNELRLCSGNAAETYTVLRCIDPRALRTADRETLLSGLSLNSDEDLAHFLEDFGS